MKPPTIFFLGGCAGEDGESRFNVCLCDPFFFLGGADYRYRYVLCIYVYIIHVCRHCSVGTNFSSLGGSGVADYYGHGFIEDVGRTMCFLFVV